MNPLGQSPRINWRLHLLQLLVISCGCFVAYATSLRGDFVWLDQSEIVDGDYRVENWAAFKDVWTQPLDRYMFRDFGEVTVQGGYWRPLYAMGISLDWTLWRDTAWLYHLENILWHVGLSIVLFLIGRRLVGDDPIALQAVFWGSVLFAVHPLGLQSVTWISGRKDIQCAFFGSCAILCYLKANDRTPVSWGLIGLGAICQLAALGFKELAAIVPLFLTILYVLRRPSADAMQDRQLTASYDPDGSAGFSQRVKDTIGFGGWGRLATIAALWLVTMAWMFQRSIVCGGFGLNADYPATTWVGNIATSVRVWFEYFQAVFIPIEPTLSDRWRISESIGRAELVALVAAATFFIAIGIAFVRRQRWATFGLWTLVWMLPASGLVPLRHFHAERYLYPASWGLLVMFAWAILWLLWPRHESKGNSHQPQYWRDSIEPRPYIACAALTIVAAFLAYITAHESLAWQNDQKLFSQALQRDPDYVEGQLALANLYLREKQYGKSVQLAEKAILDANDPEFTGYWSPLVAYTNLGMAQFHLERFEASAETFDQAIAFAPKLAMGHYHAGMADLALNQIQQAHLHFAQAHELQPSNREATGNLAFTYLIQGDAQQCAKLLEPLVKQEPVSLTDRKNLGSAYLVLEEFESACEQFEQVVSAEPENAVDRAKFAWALAGAGKLGKAAEELDRAQQIAPDNPVVRTVRGILNRLR